MKATNPMHSAKTRKKMSDTLKRIGHKPKVRGGNGTGPTIPQKMLAEKLDLPMEVVVVTGKKSPYPHHYKIDIANTEMLLAIEVDGGSHYSLKRQAADKKKDKFLRGIGWTVLRFSNQEVTGNLKRTAQKVSSTISQLKKQKRSSQKVS